MKKVIKKWYVIIFLVCIVGGIVGYLGYNAVNNMANASEMDAYGIKVNISDYDDIFTEDLYECSYNADTDSIHISKKNNNIQMISEDYFSKNDIKELIEKMFGNVYEYKITLEKGNNIVYHEYKDGYPTGGRAGFVLDDNGDILEANFSAGVVYEFDEDTMISYEAAYKMAVNAINGKYGEDTIIDSKASDCEHQILCDTAKEGLCYLIEGIVGHIPDKMEMNIDPVYFEVVVGIDGTYVEVASSLGY